MLHATTEKMIDMLAQTPPHAILFHGDDGVGLEAAIAHYAAKMKTPIEWIYPDGAKIAVETIRELYDRTKTKAAQRRLLVISQSDTMTTQAQNAFLKLLEEPNDSIHFALLTHAPSHLLPTIRSRTQSVNVQAISRSQSETLLQSLKVSDPTKKAQLLFLAEGKSDELTRLATDDAYFAKQSAMVKDARGVLQGTRYEAMKILHAYKDDRDSALKLVSYILTLIEGSARRSGDDSTITQLNAYLELYEVLAQNGNLRLQLTAAVV